MNVATTLVGLVVWMTRKTRLGISSGPRARFIRLKRSTATSSAVGHSIIRGLSKNSVATLKRFHRWRRGGTPEILLDQLIQLRPGIRSDTLDHFVPALPLAVKMSRFRVMHAVRNYPLPRTCRTGINCLVQAFHPIGYDCHDACVSPTSRRPGDVYLPFELLQ